MKRELKLPLFSKDLFVIRETKGGFDKNSKCIIISGLEELSLKKQGLLLEMLLADLLPYQKAYDKLQRKLKKDLTKSK